ncbi:MAG TPA: Ni/Fe-hydrogenase cytochrome b subunit [Vicinamibacterales bacterium]|nr:Ni/Fe-hydrogenase cytochrome b subunit [Vicinamibacterales bacterium]
MTEMAQRTTFIDKVLLGMTWREYVRSLFTPWDLVYAFILAIGIPLIVYRFTFGLAAATNLTQTTPWGIWIGIDMLSGIALAAGGFTIASTVYLLGMEKYHPIVRPAILTGFLGYLFAVFGLLCDLGSPWRLPVPILFSFGTRSIMFEVAWCVALYSTVLFLEFTPALFEWLGWAKLRQWALRATIALTVLGVVLSTLHQSSLGGLFLMAKGKLHPLWYTPYIPLFFFISAVIAGLSMVIVESSLSHRLFGSQIDPDQHVDLDDITIGLSRAAAIVLFAYFFIRLQALIDSGAWALLATPYGAWYLFEILGFILVPSLLYAYGARGGRVKLLRVVAGWTVLGVVVNRLNVSVIAMNWQVTPHYFPSWMEIVTTITIITAGVLAFRWIVNRMPILHEDPRYA